MKNTILLLLGLILIPGLQLFAQCVADAGPDKVVCIGNDGLEPIQIGGNPTAVSGTPPFTYTWEGRYEITIGTLTFVTTASEILNDTTLANPTVVNNDLLNNFRLILTIKDADNNVSKDTMELYYSIFNYTMQMYIFSINQGDSILLNMGSNVGGGMPPLQYLWRPNHGLQDSTHLNFWAKPDYSIDYYATVTDTAGCSFEGPDLYKIIVYPVSTDEIISSKEYVTVFPNPASEKIVFTKKDFTKENLKLTIFNISGKLVFSKTFQEKQLEVDVRNFSSGIYNYQLTGRKEVISQGSFIVE